MRLVVHRSPTPLGREDLLRLAQRIAYERLTWHEIMSWYYHAPVRTFGEQQSTFSPEDQNGPVTGAQWFDSGVVFWDQRYLFKRNIHALTTVFPWRVPAGAEIGCDGAIAPFIGRLPRTTVLGV